MPTGVAIRCDHCDAEWDVTVARFCGRCGAALDGTATPPPRRRRSLAARLIGVGAIVALVAVAVTGPPRLGLTWSRHDPEVALPEPDAVPDGRPLSPGERDEALAPFDENRLRCEPDGCERWRLELERVEPDWGAGLVRSMQPRTGRILVIRELDRLVAIDTRSGDRLWETDLRVPGTDDVPPRGAAAPPVSQAGGAGLVVVGSGSTPGPGWVRAYELATGDERWTAEVAHAVRDIGLASPASVVTVELDHSGGLASERLTVLDTTDGSVRWSVEATSAQLSDHGVIVVDDGEATVRDPVTGEPSITMEVGDGHVGSAGPWLLMAGASGELALLDPSTGQRIATFAELRAYPVQVGDLWVTVGVLPAEPAPDGADGPARTTGALIAVALTEAGEIVWEHTLAPEPTGRCCPVVVPWQDDAVLVRAAADVPALAVDAVTGELRPDVVVHDVPAEGWLVDAETWLGSDGDRGSVALLTPGGRVSIAGRSPWVVHGDPLVVADGNTLMGVDVP